MPTFIINTNVPESKIPDNFLKELSSLVAQLLGKPEMYVCIYVNAGQKMTFAGTTDPCASCQLSSIGKIGAAENKASTTALMEKIQKDLQIAPDRMYITFIDLERQNVGWNMKTFAG